MHQKLSTMDQNLLRPEIIKLLEENKGNTSDSGIAKDVLDKIPKAKETKAKLHKWNYCISK